MKILFHQQTGTLRDYNRADDEPVFGLEAGLEVFDLIQQEPPQHDTETQYLEAHQTVDVDNRQVIQGWIIRDIPPKVPSWPNVQAFADILSDQEMAAVSLSSDATIAFLRMKISTWLGRVEVQDERVQLGLGRMVELGIIDSARKAEIEAQAS